MSDSIKPLVPPIARQKGQSDAQYVDKLRLSARGYKTHLTLACKHLLSQLELFEVAPSQFGADQLYQAFGAVELARDKVLVRLQEVLENCATDVEVEAAELDITTYTEKATKMAAAMNQAFSDQGYSPATQISQGKPRLYRRKEKFQQQRSFLWTANQRSSAHGWSNSKLIMPQAVWTDYLSRSSRLISCNV